MATKILVVDDEPDLELLVKQKFRKKISENKIEFIFARNGIEALKKLQEQTDLDIILTDINMPEMDGLVLLSLLPTLNRVYKAVVISAYGDMNNIRSAMNKGASDFIIKPIDFQDLEITIDKTIEQCRLLKEAAAAQSRLTDIERELSIAKRLQESMLPRGDQMLPHKDKYDIFGCVLPAKSVSGDYYDYFRIDNDHIGLLVADVSGKSISAALFMATCRALFRFIAPKNHSPKDVLQKVNDLLSSSNDPCMFVTSFYIVFNVNTGRLSFANAGHNPPYLLKEDGSIRKFGTENGFVMGILESDELEKKLPFIEQSINLNPNDRIIIYTDGINEAMNEKRDLYGSAQLENVLKNKQDLSLPLIFKAIIEDIQRFSGTAEQSDDITVLALNYHPNRSAVSDQMEVQLSGNRTFNA